MAAAISKDVWSQEQGSGLYIPGRLVLNLWRILRTEVNLQSHAFEASAAAVLRKRRAPSCLPDPRCCCACLFLVIHPVCFLILIC